MLHLLFHDACACPCHMPMSVPHVHAAFCVPSPCCMSMSMLFVHLYAACPCVCCVSMSMLQVHVQYSIPCSCRMSMFFAASPCPCFMSMYMLHFHVQAISMSMSVVYVRVHTEGYVHLTWTCTWTHIMTWTGTWTRTWGIDMGTSLIKETHLRGHLVWPGRLLNVGFVLITQHRNETEQFDLKMTEKNKLKIGKAKKGNSPAD